ncbi:cytidine deaminase [Butyrivibrio sp. VCB2001]|uniref:cytidine deaminase n=1 Tax=Butyrivibrio sp. VCB2001 TaxID=1280667 RepID=UPI0004100DF7|nr:cytidine deaminase [Butyrivibrio sp. VCB2001]
MDSQIQELVKTALSMRKMSYTPYSHFNVGAALLGADGKIYTGCNIENASYTPTNCAERTAFFKAVSEGVRDFTAIAIAGGKEDATELDYCPPCGVCRQVMSEFCKDDFKIFLVKSETEYKEYTLTELVPERFTPNNLLG